MKVLVLSLLCAVAGNAAGGAVSWPGAALALSAPVFNSVVQPETKSFAYSTTQYINSLPLSYSVGLRPQLAYQVPQALSFSPLQAAYYPVAGASYFPASSIFYPSAAPAAPVSPVQTIGTGANYPTASPGGDADTAVVDSADFPTGQQQQQISSTEAPMKAEPSAPQLPPASSFPSFPQIPQLPGNVPSIPQFPQVPQIPSFPQRPQGPLQGFPQGPSSLPPSSFPSADSGDKGLNDEDTISVESA